MPLTAPNRLVLDAFSDPQIAYKTSYSSFTNTFPSAIQGAKGLEVVNASLVNSALQLNDASQLFFWYYTSTSQAGIVNSSNLKCVRLLPSTYVPNASFSAFTKNRYFNTVDELVSALNTASATGDSATYNPYWVANGVVFSYDTTTRQISVASGRSSYYIAPAAYDDPKIAAALATTPITQYGYGASVVNQQYSLTDSMNVSLGFSQGYNTRGLWFDTTNGQVGVATPTGVPQLYGTTILPTNSPILFGSQFVSVYLDINQNGGFDPTFRNCLTSIPITVPSLNVISYYPSNHDSIRNIPDSFNTVTVTLRDQNGILFPQPLSYNVRIELSVVY